MRRLQKLDLSQPNSDVCSKRRRLQDAGSTELDVQIEAASASRDGDAASARAVNNQANEL